MKCHTFTTLTTHKMHEFRLIFDVLFLQILFVNLGSKQEMPCAFSFLRTCLLRYRELLFQALFSLRCLYLSLGEAVITVLAEDLGMSATELTPGVFIQCMLSCPACCISVTTHHIPAIGMVTYPQGLPCYTPSLSASSRTTKFYSRIFSCVCCT